MRALLRFFPLLPIYGRLLKDRLLGRRTRPDIFRIAARRIDTLLHETSINVLPVTFPLMTPAVALCCSSSLSPHLLLAGHVLGHRETLFSRHHSQYRFPCRARWVRNTSLLLLCNLRWVSHTAPSAIRSSGSRIWVSVFAHTSPAAVPPSPLLAAGLCNLLVRDIIPPLYPAHFLLPPHFFLLNSSDFRCQAVRTDVQLCPRSWWCLTLYGLGRGEEAAEEAETA